MFERHALAALLALPVASFAGFATAAPDITSNFDRGAEGWTISDLNCSNYASVLGGGTLNWLRSGGNPGGFVRSTDPSSNCYAFQAPSSFLGDQSCFFGGTLSWSVRTNIADWEPGSVLILIGGGLVLVADVPQPETGSWFAYEVGLVASNFRLNNANGPAVSGAQFAQAIANVTALRISAEFGSEAGEETVDLDSVRLSRACPGDLDGDQIVDAPDLAILLGEWGQSDCLADLDDDGTVGPVDLAILLGAWGPC